MKIFVFGAGASRGSQYISHQDASKIRAPLVDELFDSVYERYAADVGLSAKSFHEYRQSVKENGSLEKWLTKKWEESEIIESKLFKDAEKADMGRLPFYIWWLLQNVSNTYNYENGYEFFLDVLRNKREEFGLISFNYDTLLDRAVKQIFGRQLVNSIESYFAARLIKPHGSVNWFLQKRSIDEDGHRMVIDRKIDLASSLIFKPNPISMENMQIVGPDDPHLSSKEFIGDSRFNSQYCYPLIFLPLTVKQYNFVEGFSEKIINEGKKLLQRAKEVYLVGYRARDEIIKDMFKEVSEGTVLNVVGLKGARVIMDRVLGWDLGFSKGKVYHKGFESFIEELRDSSSSTEVKV